jgi:hypothetical protein
MHPPNPSQTMHDNTDVLGSSADEAAEDLAASEGASTIADSGEAGPYDDGSASPILRGLFGSQSQE